MAPSKKAASPPKKTATRSRKGSATEVPKPRASRARKATVASLLESLRQLQETTAGLSAEVHSLKDSMPSQGRGPGLDDEGGDRGSAPDRSGSGVHEDGILDGLAARLEQMSERLAQSLAEVPTPADFEPLAEHLYQFAQTAPALKGSLEEISETLQFTHDSFAESLLTLPRAEDYEPLTKPLQEFAKVSPVLAESLSEVLKVTVPLADAVRGLREIGHGLESTREEMAAMSSLAPAASPTAEPSPRLQKGLREVAAGMEGARETLLVALATLPREPEYTRFAADLRELAGVSPSLMEWLEQVPTVTEPLAESVRGLDETARCLGEGRDKLVALIEELEARGKPADPGRIVIRQKAPRGPTR